MLHGACTVHACTQGFSSHTVLSFVQVGRLEGLESEVDQLQNVLQSVANELESGHQHAQVTSETPRQLVARYKGKYWLLDLMSPWQFDI